MMMVEIGGKLGQSLFLRAVFKKIVLSWRAVSG
jgi:hypothetical protein